jgi:hypothetical protein
LGWRRVTCRAVTCRGVSERSSTETGPGMSPGPARIVGMLAWNGVGMEPGVRTCHGAVRGRKKTRQRYDSQSRADTRVTSDSTCLSPVFIRGVDGLGCHRLANPTSNPSSMHLHLQGRDSACADLGAATFWKIPLHVDAKMLKPPMGPWIQWSKNVRTTLEKKKEATVLVVQCGTRRCLGGQSLHGVRCVKQERGTGDHRSSKPHLDSGEEHL